MVGLMEFNLFLYGYIVPAIILLIVKIVVLITCDIKEGESFIGMVFWASVDVLMPILNFFQVVSLLLLTIRYLIGKGGKLL